MKSCNLKTSSFGQEKYSRQTIMKEIGFEGQEKLKKSKVAIVGLGALGTNAAELLVRAGVGNLKLIDPDSIENSNLQRQTLFEEKDIGKNKAETAKAKLEKINSLVRITARKITLNKNNLSELKNADLVLDCTDNLETRFLINAFCRKEKLPWIHASCVKTSGYVMPILPKGPCLECFLRQADLDSACTIGILNTLPAMIGALQATLAIRSLVGEKVEPELIYFDAWKMELKRLKVRKNKRCKVCGKG